MKDNLYSSKDIKGDFCFDEKVAEVFDDMLVRSVPFYGEVQSAIADLAKLHYKEGSLIYDLGCSTGTTIIKICKKIAKEELKIRGVDSSGPVIGKAKEKIGRRNLKGHIELICSDIMDVEIKNASVVVMNYTLQFIRPELRKELVRRVYDGLVEGGIFLLSEKVLENDEAMSRLFIEQYHDFKRDMGYSDLEISKKKEALDNVLVPLKMDDEIKLLNEGGFERVSIFFKCFNFASFIAVKSNA